MRTFFALFMARNKEFLRDRATLMWTFAFPFVVMGAIALIFSGEGRELYKVGVVGLDAAQIADLREAARLADPAGAAAGADGAAGAATDPVRAFLGTRFIEFVPVDDLVQAQDRVRHHQFDLLVEAAASSSTNGGASIRDAPRYWVNPSNPKGYFLERALWANSAGANGGGGDGVVSAGVERGELTGREIRYIDWLLPGVLAMNVLFSCLWGVGYVIVRYRKGLILRRFKAAPISAVQFICSQIASRLVLVLINTSLLFFGMDLILDFYNAGALLDLLVVLMLGGICLIALGVAIAARTTNQELAGGMINLATWPMMFLSGIWFSLEGSQQWLIGASKLLPLTHLIDAARKIMVDGATLSGVAPELTWLSAMTVVFLAVGAALFRWE